MLCHASIETKRKIGNRSVLRQTDVIIVGIMRRHDVGAEDVALIAEVIGYGAAQNSARSED